ncbi:hypothetical protein JZ751_003989 [Albula glossodonta]|uniref:Uncharacterized protein n=1 Tax=Albula glossodonta TaxID=121402 RepID=A0A8T2P7U3_9TELE|nr:hypothetical protein JZ751_003989 [Albula glossodonta]
MDNRKLVETAGGVQPALQVVEQDPTEKLGQAAELLGILIADQLVPLHYHDAAMGLQMDQPSSLISQSACGSERNSYRWSAEHDSKRHDRKVTEPWSGSENRSLSAIVEAK